MIFLQIIINSLSQGAIYSITALSLALVLYPIRVFHIALGGIIIAGAYAQVYFTQYLHFPWYLSLVCSLLASVAIGLLGEFLIYRPLFYQRSSSLSVAISSLALYFVLINTVSLLFGNKSYFLPGDASYKIFEGLIINKIQAVTFISVALIFYCLGYYLRTGSGRALRAMEDNPTLLNVFGWDIIKLRTTAIMLSSALAGLAGILVAYDKGVESTMGMQLLLNALVVVIVSGPGAYNKIPLVAFALAFVYKIIGFYLSPSLADAVMFAIAVVFLFAKPQGLFSASRRIEELL